MAINKVVYGDDTLIDLTQDSVSAENLLEGETAHDRSGVPVTGTAKQGHILKNQAGTAMTQQPNMQFADAHLTNDATNSATEIETFKALTSQEYAQATEDGAYIITDGDGAVIGPASEDYVEVTADGEKTFGQLFAEVFTDVDITKANKDTVFEYSNSSEITVFNIVNIDFSGQRLIFSRSRVTSNFMEMTVILSATPAFYSVVGDSNSQLTFDTSYISSVPSSGTKITLHYGNRKATVDLQTTANRCWYDSNNTVKQKIDDVDTRFIYERRIDGHSSLHFILSTYSTGAIISCAVRDAKSLLMVFSNGWLNIVSNDTDYLTVDFNRNNYKEFTITNSKNDGGYVSIITRARVEFL